MQKWQYTLIKTLIISANSIISLKYQRSTPSGGKVIGIGKSEFVAKSQFL